jgi:hypothetical protein
LETESKTNNSTLNLILAKKLGLGNWGICQAHHWANLKET